MKRIYFLLVFLLVCSFCYGQRQLGIVNIGTPSTTTTINVDNFILDVSGKSYIRIASDNATANTRTVVLTQGSLIGQLLYIEFTGSNACEFLDNGALSGGGNIRLSGNFNMNSQDALVLLWNGVDWIQVTRSAN